MSNVKVLEDILPSAYKFLVELDELRNNVATCRELLAPYDSEKRAKHGKLPRYVVYVKTELEKLNLRRFELIYPATASIIKNTQSRDEGMYRFYDAIYKIGELNEKLRAIKYVVMSEDDRRYLIKLTNIILADLCIFIIIQYSLNTMEKGIYLSLQQFCNSKMISPDVYYGDILNCLDSTGETPYGFETISKYYEELLELDAVFVAECEEHNFPLTEDICDQLVKGDLSFAEARGQLTAYLRQYEEKEVEGMNPGNMISRLNLL